MTTIACDGSIMAGDGQVTGCGLVHSLNFVKVHHLDDGRVVGWAGTPFQKKPLLDFLNGVTSETTMGDDFEALILHPDGKCYCMDGNGNTYDQPTPAAVGSGAPVALAVMSTGLDAIEAVSIARTLDTLTGGEIVALSPLV